MLESLVILSSGASFNQYRETIQYAKEHGYQWIEWYLEYYRLPSWKGLRNNFFETIRESNLPFSFHAPVNDVELALKDKNYSRVALDYLKMYIDFLGELAPVNFTIHVGARRIPIEELSWDLAMDNLKGLAEHGFSKNVRVCIENLAHGWAGYPELLMQMAESVDAGITFDIGHARGSPWVQKNYGNVLQFLI